MIQKIILIFLVLSSTIFALDWAKDMDSAFAQAKKEHKNVMVMVEGKYCRWCKKMKGRTLSDDAVEKRLKQYVVVKVFRENAKAMATLPPIDGVPTIFFLNEHKAVMQEVIGYFDAGDFISYINDVEKKPN